MTAAHSAAKALDYNDEDDLYDAVLTGSVDKEKTFPSKQSKTEVNSKVKTDDAKSTPSPKTSKCRPPKLKLGLYIGKFPWWITEDDVVRVANNAGVQDVIEVKFAENKVNGLSKGYVKVVVGSESSMKLLLERVPKNTLGGEKIICCFANNSNLALFEDMAKESVPGLPPRAATFNMNDSGTSFLPQDPFDSTLPQQFLNQFGNTVPPVPNPYLSYPPPPLPYMPPPSLLPFMFLNHMNSPGNPSQEQNANFEMACTSQERRSSKTNSDEKKDKDFEELINRNKAVASTAISKAVSGATTGDLKVAMETLLTAISIIKQSRVYRDNRCQAMVISLKDCLVSIKGSFGFNRHSEEKERDRRKSSSKERRRSSRGDRDRSRSSERSSGRSKERSREQDRHRDRDSDRDRYY